MSAISPDEKPPRVSRGLYLRYLIAAVLVIVCTAATVASAGLLEVKSLVAIVKTNGHPIPNIKGALDDVRAAARRPCSCSAPTAATSTPSATTPCARTR